MILKTSCHEWERGRETVYGWLTGISILLLAFMLYLNRRTLFTDVENVKVLIMIFVFLPLLLVFIAGAVFL